jgi:hypothetical protein
VPVGDLEGQVPAHNYEDLNGDSYYLDQEGTFAENGKYVLGNVNGDAHTGAFVRDLLKAADEQLDFSMHVFCRIKPISHEGYCRFLMYFNYFCLK